MDAVREELDRLAGVYAYGQGPTTFILGAHILFCALCFRSSAITGEHRWLVSLCTTFFSGFGGGLTTAILIGRPDLAPIPALKDPRLLPMTVLIWYIVQYTSIGGVIARSWMVRAISRACSTYSRSNQICGRTELAATLFPGSYCAHLLLGTLSGAGGRLLSDLVLHGTGQLGRTGELSKPTFSLRSALFGAAIYLTTVHLLPDEIGLLAHQGKALVTTVLLLHAVSSEVLELPLEFTAPMAAVFHAVSGIPEYSPALATEKNGAAEKKIK